jgi:polar amino acid transport system permease protein
MVFDFRFALAVFPSLLQAAQLTIFITISSFLLAMIGGLGVLLLQRSTSRPLSRSATAIADFVRSTPVLVQIYFLYFLAPDLGVKLSPLSTGIVALSVHYSCYLAEAYRAGLEAVPRGQWDAVHALGFNRLQAYGRIILPQALQPVVPIAGTYLVHMFKETPLLASISVAEMMFVASEIGADRFRYLEPITICGLLFLIMSLGAARVIATVERAYGRRWRKR